MMKAAFAEGKLNKDAKHCYLERKKLFVIYKGKVSTSQEIHDALDALDKKERKRIKK